MLIQNVEISQYYKIIRLRVSSYFFLEIAINLLIEYLW